MSGVSYSRDEVRRRARDADAVQQEVVPRWREAMRRSLTGDQPLPPGLRAQLIGSPGRRQVLRIGATSVLGAAVLAACAPDRGPVAETGTTEVRDTSSTTFGTTTTTQAAPDDPVFRETRNTNLTLLRTATSLELAAVEVYGIVAGAVDDGDLRLDQAVIDAATLFRDHHQQHAETLQGATEDLDGQPYRDANPILMEELMQVRLPTVIDQESAVILARDLELSAAATYVEATGMLSTIELRQTLMGIGAVEARHASVLNLVLGNEAVTDPVVETLQRVPDAAAIPAEGEPRQAAEGDGEGGGEGGG